MGPGQVGSCPVLLGECSGCRAACGSRQMGLDDRLPSLRVASGDRLMFKMYLLLDGRAMGKAGVVSPEEQLPQPRVSAGGSSCSPASDAQ